MSPQATDLVQGTLEVLILKTLALEPMHGWGIGQRIQQVSKDVLQVGQGSLYPALHRLEAKGWIHSEWGPSENNRRARYYSLTKSGRTSARDHPAVADGLLETRREVELGEFSTDPGDEDVQTAGERRLHERIGE